MNSVTGDQEVYLKSVSDNSDESPITSRDVLWINDQNNGSYNGQITFDTSLFNSSSKWLSYSEAYLEVPFVMSAKSNVNVAASFNAYYAGLKSGYHQLIDSISVEYGTKNVVQLQSYVNFHTQFKLMTSFSQDDVAKYGSSIGLIPDSAGSYQFKANASNFGDGYSNVDETYSAATNARIRPESFNEGFLKRRAMTTAFPAGGYGVNTINTEAKCKRIGKNYQIVNGTAENAVCSWYIIATIRLKDLSEFFSKISLVKNGSMRITLNYNSSTTTIYSGPAVTGPPAFDAGMRVITHVQNSGHTNPIMIGQASDGTASAGPTIAAASEITFTCGILKNSLDTAGSFAITSCRLYVPSYKLDPKRELAMITKNPITKVTYNDIYSYNFTITSGESFNQILTNGIVDAQYLLLIPFVRGSATGTFASALIPVYQSPFDSAPGTTSPMCALTELQVTLGGENVYTQNERYDYEAFLNELSRINGLLGGVTTGLTSGLIDRYMFDNAYRYYVADLSRRNSAEDLVPKAIHVSGTNVTELPLEILAFVAYRRHLNIDTLTGMELN
jgi:hypothetical protein